MKEFFSDSIAIVIVLVGLFVLPMVFLAERQDTITQSLVYTKTVNFVQEVQEQGYISQEMYNDFTRELDNTGLIFNIEMEHVHDVISPVFSDDGEAVIATTSFDSSRYEGEILDKLYSENGVYYLEQGDYFTVTVSNRSRTLNQNFLKIFSQASTKYSVIATYGGRIRNEKY